MVDAGREGLGDEDVVLEVFLGDGGDEVEMGVDAALDMRRTLRRDERGIGAIGRDIRAFGFNGDGIHGAYALGYIAIGRWTWSTGWRGDSDEVIRTVVLFARACVCVCVWLCV